MKSERLRWIDVARGFGILFVIYAHGLNGDSIRYIFYAFHMPLFFFLSGIVYHHRSYETFLHFLQKTAKRILVPYFFFALASYALWLVNAKIAGARIDPVPDVLLGILYGNGNFNALSFNVVLWFLPCLFVTKILFALLTYVSENKYFLLTWLLIFAIIGFAFSRFFPLVKMPFGIETALSAVVFFGGGYMWNKYSRHFGNYINKWSRFLFVIFLALCIVFATLNFNISGHQIDLRLNRLDNVFLFYFAAFSGILATIALSISIGRNRILEYLGKHSLQLFVWHLVAFSYITRILRTSLSPETIDSLRNMYLTPLYTVISIFVILFLDRVIKQAKIRPTFLRKKNP